MRILLLAILLTGCAERPGKWPSGSRARPLLVGVDPSLAQAWRLTVDQALASWGTRINTSGDCPMPFVIANPEDSGACDVRLVTETEWPRDPGIVGATQDCYIDIRGSDPTGKRPVLTHEFGHAFGLEHSDDPQSIMHASVEVQEPSDADVRDARAVLGCD